MHVHVSTYVYSRVHACFLKNIGAHVYSRFCDMLCVYVVYILHRGAKGRRTSDAVQFRTDLVRSPFPLQASPPKKTGLKRVVSVPASNKRTVPDPFLGRNMSRK